MCMMVYIASDYLLPTWKWDRASSRFHVTELSAGDESVRRHFSKPCVYCVGSHEGCGCGFQYGQYVGFEEDAGEQAAAHDSRRRLADFLAVGLQHQLEVELFVCWDGDQAAQPEHRERVRPADLFRIRTFFREKELLVVSES